MSSVVEKKDASAPNETAFLIRRFGGRFTVKQLLWQMPLAILNQIVPAALYEDGVNVRTPRQQAKIQRQLVLCHECNEG